jgi:hypothetical protein
LSALCRLHKIDRELARAAYPSAVELAATLGVATRTVKRDRFFPDSRNSFDIEKCLALLDELIGAATLLLTIDTSSIRS